MLRLQLLEGRVELVVPWVQNKDLEAESGRRHPEVGDGYDAGEPSHDEGRKEERRWTNAGKHQEEYGGRYDDREETKREVGQTRLKWRLTSDVVELEL